MKLSQFKFKLPQDKIAQYPAPHRDECRMMVLHRKTGEIEHRMFKDLLTYFDENDLFVFNDTKVFPARLYGNKEKTGACIEVFLLRELNQELRLWDVLVDPARKIRIGNKLYFGEDNSIVAEVIDNTTSRGRTLRFLYDGDHDEFKKQLYALGEAPIPRFIGRPSEPEDLERFQCIFAKNEGAVTAPATGLHDIVNKTKEEEHKVVAVGTTVQRALEACVGTNARIKAFEGWTNKFIFPPYNFTVADAMLSNFHLPYSTMLMLTAAFGDYDYTMHAYNVALKEDYKFGPYGDVMLIID